MNIQLSSRKEYLRAIIEDESIEAVEKLDLLTIEGYELDEILDIALSV